jgi:drug/metabolite transporter (DMT)-like permease
VTAVAFVLWYSAVSALGPGRVGLLTGIAPVSAALAGSRVPGPQVWLGVLAVMAALAAGLGWRGGSRRPKHQGGAAEVCTSAIPAKSGATNRN